MENNIDKRTLRKEMSVKRNALSSQECKIRSEQIAMRLLQSDMFEKSERICIYKAFRNEVSCDTICQKAWETGKEVYVPITDESKKRIDFYSITEQTVWKEGAYGIMEPVLAGVESVLDAPALILMPGLVFDRNKHRIGYGGGYYDKYLATHPIHITAALCYDFQITVQELPSEEHDILPDYLITEQIIL